MSPSTRSITEMRPATDWQYRGSNPLGCATGETMRVIRGSNGKVWGHTDGEYYYTKRGSDHFCYKHNGYGIQKNLLERLKEMGVRLILIDATMKTYTTHIETWFKFGVEDTLREEDGKQVFLSLDVLERRFDKVKKLDAF